MILQVTQQQGGIEIPQLADDITLSTVLSESADFTASSVYWFYPYKASDFPEITCDKEYFFLWSTDHDGGDGGIWWGKGDNLDLSDFEEVALITDGYQSESPILMRFPSNPRVIHLYYHTDAADPSGNSGQNTKLWTTNGGAELHLCSWTDEGEPLGFQTGQQHTGYLRISDINGSLVCTHHFDGIAGSGQTFQRSTTTDGLSFSRGILFDKATSFGTELLSAGQWWFKHYRTTFVYGGKNYAFMNMVDDNEIQCADNRQVFSLVRIDGDLNVLQVLKTFEKGRQQYVYIDGDTAHIYTLTNEAGTPCVTDDIKHGTYDLTPLNFM